MTKKEKFYDQRYKIDAGYTTYYTSNLAEAMIQIALWLQYSVSITIKVNPDFKEVEPIDTKKLAEMCNEILGTLKD